MKQTRLTARDELIQLSGGYINTPGGVKKERGAGAHFDRASGRYIGTLIGGPVGLPIGWLIDRSRRKHNILRTSLEPKAPDEFGKGPRKFSAARAALDDIINFKAVDLGYTYGDLGGCNPCDSDKKKHYPSLNIYDRETDLDLPLSGKAIVRYKLRSKTTRQNDEGKKKHSADIEIQSIDPIEEEEKAPKEGEKAKRIGLSRMGPVHRLSARDELDLILLADPRPRNTLGEFSGGEDGGPSPAAMRVTYGQVAKNIGPTLAGGAVAGTGAALAGSAVRSLLDKIKGRK